MLGGEPLRPGRPRRAGEAEDRRQAMAPALRPPVIRHPGQETPQARQQAARRRGHAITQPGRQDISSRAGTSGIGHGRLSAHRSLLGQDWSPPPALARPRAHLHHDTPGTPDRDPGPGPAATSDPAHLQVIISSRTVRTPAPWGGNSPGRYYFTFAVEYRIARAGGGRRRPLPDRRSRWRGDKREPGAH